MKKRRGAEQIVAMLRQADVSLGKGQKVPEVCKEMGISEQTYYRWRTKYGGMDPQMAKQLQELQKENARLKRLVAEQRWTTRFCVRTLAQTGKPRATAANDRTDSSSLGAESALGASRLSGLWPGPFDAALPTEEVGRRSSSDRRAASLVRVSSAFRQRAGSPVAAGNRLAGELQASAPALEAGAPTSAGEAAETASFTGSE